MTGLSLRNPLASLTLGVALMVFAVVLTPRMSVDTFPDLTPPVLVVGTLAPGLGAKDVEKTLTWRIEKYVSATPGVEHVQSNSRNNLSIVYVWMTWGTNLNSAQTLVQQQVAFAMSAVPKSLGVIPPFVLQYDPTNAPVVQVTVSGGGLTGPELYDYALNYVEPLLEGIPGVASASPNGGSEQRQINVVVDPAAAQARGVTAADVATAVAQSNALLPSGEFIAPTFDANVYTNAVPERVARIGDALVKEVNGAPVLIRDVARVEDGGAAPTQTVSVNGENAVYLNVLRVPGGNTLAIVEAVKKRVAGLADLPKGLAVKPVFDASTFVRTSYTGLQREIGQALVLISLVILLFLQSVRGTVIVAIAIPLSFAITLIVLYSTGQTLNAFTLGGLTLAMGRLVDDAVVVLESIHRHRRNGLDAREAALQGANAVALPVLASTLTTMAVLMPVLLLAGLAKKLFALLALTVAVAMTASYVVSMWVTPVACQYFLGHAEHGRVARSVEHVIDGIADRYSRLLRAALPARGVIIVACALLTGAAVCWAPRTAAKYVLPRDRRVDGARVRALLPRDVARGVVASHQRDGKDGRRGLAFRRRRAGPHQHRCTRERAQRDDEPQRRPAHGLHPRRAEGRGASHAHPARARRHDASFARREIPRRGVPPMARRSRRERVRERLPRPDRRRDQEREPPGARGAGRRGRGGGADRRRRARHPRRAPERLPGDPRRHDARPGRHGRRHGPPGRADDVGRHAGEHQPPQRLDRSRQWPVLLLRHHLLRRARSVTGRERARTSSRRAWSPRTARRPRSARTPEAFPSGLQALVAIERDHMQRVTEVYMQTEGRDVGSAAAELEKKLAADPRTRSVALGFVGQVDLMRTTFGGLGVAIGLAIMVVFIVMTIQFKSLRLPFVMLFTIPVCLVGITLALVAARQGFSITALMGTLMVIGIAVSNGILLVDDANRSPDRRRRRSRPSSPARDLVSCRSS